MQLVVEEHDSAMCESRERHESLRNLLGQLNIRRTLQSIAGGGEDTERADGRKRADVVRELLAALGVQPRAGAAAAAAVEHDVRDDAIEDAAYWGDGGDAGGDGDGTADTDEAQQQAGASGPVSPVAPLPRTAVAMVTPREPATGSRRRLVAVDASGAARSRSDPAIGLVASQDSMQSLASGASVDDSAGEDRLSGERSASEGDGSGVSTPVGPAILGPTALLTAVAEEAEFGGDGGGY